jgi:hypothetical protein
VRLANDLSLNDRGRFQLMALAEHLMKRARELDAQTTLLPQQFQSENVEYQDGRSQMSEPDIQNVTLLQVQTD